MDLYVFVDIPDKKDKRKSENIRENKRVIDFLSKYQKSCESFRNIKVEIADRHKGLADSIIYGVSKIINQYGKVIVLEDDLEVSNDFLDYMQRGLIFYQNDKRIWSLGGHCYEMKIPTSYKKDVFLAPRIESWGWGTWIDRWNRTDWSVKSYKKFKKDIIGRVLFNIGGKDLYKMLVAQMENKNFDSWAIRWCYQEFLERKYTLYPVVSRVIHCGNDDRSTHTTYNSAQVLREKYKKCKFEHINLNIKVIWNFKKANDAMV